MTNKNVQARQPTGTTHAMPDYEKGGRKPALPAFARGGRAKDKIEKYPEGALASGGSFEGYRRDFSNSAWAATAKEGTLLLQWPLLCTER